LRDVQNLQSAWASCGRNADIAADRIDCVLVTEVELQKLTLPPGRRIAAREQFAAANAGAIDDYGFNDGSVAPIDELNGFDAGISRSSTWCGPHDVKSPVSKSPLGISPARPDGSASSKIATVKSHFLIIVQLRTQADPRLGFRQQRQSRGHEKIARGKITTLVKRA
jgi:hypothetical protein